MATIPSLFHSESAERTLGTEGGLCGFESEVLFSFPVSISRMNFVHVQDGVKQLPHFVRAPRLPQDVIESWVVSRPDRPSATTHSG